MRRATLPITALSVARPRTLGVIICAVALGACAPTFSDLQSARLAGPKRVEITPSYSSVSFSNEGEREKVQDHVGVQVATGISERTDLRLRYELITLGDGESSTIHVLGAGPKLSLAKDRAAFYVPIGFAFGSDIETSETFQVQPTLLLTAPFSNQFEVTASGKALLWFDRDNDDLFAFNVGLGLSNDLTKWVLRPEAGILVNPGEDGTFWQYSLGLTFYTGR